MSVFARTLFFALASLALVACADEDASYEGSYKSANNREYPNSQAPNYGNQTSTSYAPPGQMIPGDSEPEPEPGVEVNKEVQTKDEPTSTFSIDVDNASYTYVRSMLKVGDMPEPKNVRPEEFINFFDYVYPQPVDDKPFSINLESAPSKFGQGKHLVRVGIKGKLIDTEDLKPTNLVFLIDVSGSMSSGNKLDMVKASLNTLVSNLRPSDTVGIVVYAGADRVVLPPTAVSDKQKIGEAIRDLKSGGSTNAEAGIVKAYKLAELAKIQGGNNRVVLLTDGDFNVGLRDKALVDLIVSYREKEISLTCMGYGNGNYKDIQMENLSNEGNGNYFYVDTVQEAERVFGSALASTLEVIAADVKIQVEFNPNVVDSYRLIGYENRVLENKDFEDDTKDAGEIGPGHTVTAYYEVQMAKEVQDAKMADVRIRYKSQYGESSQLIERALKSGSVHESFEAASPSFQLGAYVAEFAEVLRQRKYSFIPDLTPVKSGVDGLSKKGMKSDKVDELLQLVEKADQLRVK